MKRIATGLLIFALFIAALAWVFRERLAMRLMERTVARNLERTLLDEVPDGLHVALCGAGSPLPDPERSGPCVAVAAGERLFIVDAGAGASRILSRVRLPQGRIEALLLTHFHSDHMDGMGELMLQRWVNGAHASPLPIHGPPGVERVVAGFNEAYAQDAGYRVAHHGANIVPPTGAGGTAMPFAIPPDGTLATLFEGGDLKVSALAIDHAPVAPAVAYRFDYKGRSVVISGDTKKSANLQNLSRGVDLLVHEALSPTLVGVMTRGAAAAGKANIEKITVDIVDYHTSPVEAAEIARAAGVGFLLFYHIVPPLPLAPLRSVFLDGVDDVYDGPVAIGRDGTIVHMPAGSQQTELEELL